MNRVLSFLSFALLVGLGAVAYLLTSDPSQEDPCINPQNDISAAILGDEADQDALANRAMLQRKMCEARAADKSSP
ncbi:MAG: hypothetical protein ACI8RN_002026 [Glaciecola sp.]|jgi:hypothetical protein|uniref:hypothetical protein n=1 Tax=Congregibacter sp. TaxID=2744308 RepID=UPI0039E2D3CA